MYYIDYHTHCEYSEDSQEKLENIIKQAIKIGLDEIAITDHLDILKNKLFNHSIDLENLFLDVKNFSKKYDKKIKIRQGIELGQPYLNDEEANKFYKNYNVDFIIGSVHYDDNNIDMPEYNFEGLDCNKIYKEYLNNVKILAKNYDYDVLGHLTYPLRYMFLINNITLDLSPFKKDFEEIFSIVIERKKGIEVNTSGFKTLGDTMPSLDIIKLYKKCGGEILTIGSDSHTSDYIGYKIKETLQELKKIGFKNITTYEKRQAIFKPI